MINTQDFATRTLFIERKNAPTGNKWGVALDIGYSGVKGMSPNAVFCFPAFARVAPKGGSIEIGDCDDSEIQYRDENGTIWNVGKTAQEEVSSSDTNDTPIGRSRYFAEMFKVIYRVGMALGMRTNKHGAPGTSPISLQTGLPPAYLKEDAPLLRSVMSGHHKFDVRTGNRKWETFEFELNDGDISIIAQPMGSVFSVALDNNADVLPEAQMYLKSSILVFDAGFGTVDIYSIRNRQIEDNSSSFSDVAMSEVLRRTADKLYAKYHATVNQQSMQKCLRDGYAVQRIFSRGVNGGHKTTRVPFADILEEASKAVCNAALDRVEDGYNYLFDHSYLLVTGGTGGDAWLDYIRERYADMESLQVITGNQNDTLSHIFSNVRGYYLYQASKLKALANKSKK